MFEILEQYSSLFVQFIRDNRRDCIWAVALLLVLIIDSARISHLSVLAENTRLDLDNLQVTLGVAKTPDTWANVIAKGALNPIKSEKALLPVMSDKTTDVAKIQDGFTRADNYYPIGAPIVYLLSESIDEAGSHYAKQLVNSGWQVSEIANVPSTTAGKNRVASFSATNGQSSISVRILGELEGKPKLGANESFLEIVITR